MHLFAVLARALRRRQESKNKICVAIMTSGFSTVAYVSTYATLSAFTVREHAPLLSVFERRKWIFGQEGLKL